MNHFTKQNARGSAPVTVIGGIVITVSVLVLLVKLMGTGYYADVDASTEAATETRIMPQGRVTLGDGVPPGERKGEQIFKKVCFQCHAADGNTPHAPRITNTAEWSPRLAKGFETLFNHALNGFTDKGTMPAKGGQADLTELELKRVLVYMANQSGGSFPDPDAPPPAPVAAAASSASAPAETAASAPVETAASAPAGGQTAAAPAGGASPEVMAQGKEVFGKLCFGCHAATSVIPNTPRLTHKEDWEPRIAKGRDTLFKHAIEGFTDKGMMPARGGDSSLSDDQVKAAVIYMVNESGGNF